MSSEFLLSDFGSASDTNNHSNGSHSNEGFNQSNILVADLSIRSTASNASSTRACTSLNEVSDEEVEDHDNSKKVKRRVTFNLDNVQVQTIPIDSPYSSDDSYESANSVEEDDEDYFFPITTTDDTCPPSPSSSSCLSSSSSLPSPPTPSSPSSSPFLPSPWTPSTQITAQPAQPANSTVSERISKKASYDALLQGKQIRRRDNSNHLSTTIPGYWHPLNPTTATISVANNGGSPLPTLRSLEMTERLITECIQRELALNPNLSSHAAAKRTSYTQEVSITAKPPGSPIIHNGTQSMLITDTNDDDDGDDEHSVEEKAQNNSDKTGTAINDEQRNLRNSPESFSSVLIDKDEESGTSTTASLAEPQAKYNQEKEQNKSDFTSSVYNELAKQHDPAVIPFSEYESPKLAFPFEQDLIPISAHTNVVIVPPPHNHDNPVRVDCSSLTDHTTTMHVQPQKTREIFFVKILKAENLDFPIEDDDTSVYCSIQYKSTESKSDNQKMTRTMMIDHEMRILDVDPNEQITVTIHVATTPNSKKMQQSNSFWYHRTKAPSDLQRYVHEKYGSICQTLFSPDRFMTENSLVQTASLMLVNNWYRTRQQDIKNPSSPSLLLRKTSILMKKESVEPAAIVPEKAVGKIHVQCLYLKIRDNYTPRSLDEAVEALNAKRFHNTNWQSGYLSQFEGNTKQSKKHFFKLTGGCLFAYSDSTTKDKKDNSPLYKIPLKRVTRLICDNIVKYQKPQQCAHPTSLVSQLEDVIMLEKNQEDKKAANQEKSNFQLIFDNGDKIHFGCESFEERNKWVSVMEIIICKLPSLPDWIMD